MIADVPPTDSPSACAGSGPPGIGGSLVGLNSGQSLTLQDNHADTLLLSANGSFRFATDLAAGFGDRY